MKKILALSLTLALTLSLGAAALAADLPEGWTPADGARTGEPAPSVSQGVDDAPLLIAPAPDGANEEEPTPETVDVPLSSRYTAYLYIDGEAVDTSNIPGAPVGYVPMRALCEQFDGGYADWFEEENEAFFYIDEQRVTVSLSDLSISANGEAVPDVKGYLDPAGFTFVPVSVLNGLGSITVNDHPEMDVVRFDITTTHSDPMVKLSFSIIEACEMPRISPAMPELLENLGFDMDNYVQLDARAPMMNVQSASLFLAEVAEGKMDAAKENFKAFQDNQINAFATYLPGPHEMAQNGQIVVSPDGSHLMLIISDHNDKAIELFNAAFPAEK